jgi:ferrous iron transport protein B
MKKITIALSGNPNAGKTTVFNAITGARQHIANYPGVTVEKKTGRVSHRGQEIEVVDLPGTYSLTAYSLEELVARNFLVDERPDVVVDIVDASNLDRNLYLAVQFLELGVPLVIALNMMDVAESRGIIVDLKVLSETLGVPVVPMVARANKGIPQLLDTVLEVAEKAGEWHPAALSYGLDIDGRLDQVEALIRKSKIYNPKYPPRWRALKCLEGDQQILGLLQRDPDIGQEIGNICQSISKHIMATHEEEPEAIIADHRYGFITAATKRSVKRKIEQRLNLSDKIDKVLTNRILGPLLMLGILYVIYLFTFTVSRAPVAWFEAFFERLKWAAGHVLPPGAIHSLVVSGIIDGVGGVLGFVPLILFMFLCIAVMEDSGYMARVAYMLDRVLRWFGLHGNSVISLIVSGGISGGCAVPAVLATRTLRDPKERLATLLVVPFMNCGAKLPVYAVLIAAFFPRNQARTMFLLTLLSWAFALLAAKVLRATVLRGPKTPFVMELPPYRVPTLRGLFIHAWERTWQYIKKAGTVILGFSVFFWAIMTYPGLSGDQAREFAQERAKLAETLLSSPEMREWIPAKGDLAGLNASFDAYAPAARDKDQTALSALSRSPFFPLLDAAHRLGEEQSAPPGRIENLPLNAAWIYLGYRRDLGAINAREQQTALKSTIAGWVGERLETITGPLGFDYRINIALLGGFAAKEIILSTLGTAYSLGEAAPGASGSLSGKLAKNPRWSPLLAFTLIVFTMLYVPCLVTVISIRRESSWKWAGFSVGFNLVTAYLVSLVTMQVGSALALGH